MDEPTPGSRPSPALSREEWAQWNERRCVYVPQSKQLQVMFYFDGLVTLSDESNGLIMLAPERVPSMVALHNAALPDDDPRKITRQMIADLRLAAREVVLNIGAKSIYSVQEEESMQELATRLHRHADGLAALLPPERVAI